MKLYEIELMEIREEIEFKHELMIRNMNAIWNHLEIKHEENDNKPRKCRICHENRFYQTQCDICIENHNKFSENPFIDDLKELQFEFDKSEIETMINNSIENNIYFTSPTIIDCCHFCCHKYFHDENALVHCKNHSINEIYDGIIDNRKLFENKYLMRLKQLEYEFFEMIKILMKPTCSICYEKIDEQMIILKCKHEYHVDCILKWFEQQKRCPYCRCDHSTAKLMFV